MGLPHEYIPAVLGHSDVACKHCWGTPAENAILGPNRCPSRMTTEAPAADVVELKPCPFCGSDARFGPLDGGSVTVWCHAECGAEITRKLEVGAITAWNTRSTVTEITRLRAENDELSKTNEVLASQYCTASRENAELKCKLDEAVNMLVRWQNWSCGQRGDSPFFDVRAFLTSIRGEG